MIISAKYSFPVVLEKTEYYIIDHIRNYRFTFCLVILIGFLNNIVSFLLPISIGEYFTLFFHEGTSKGRLLNWMGIEFSTINQFFLFFCCLIILKGVFAFIENYGTFRQGESFVKNIREMVFSAQIHWSAEAFLQRSYGKYLLRYSNDLKSVQNYLTRGYMEGIKSSLFLLTGIVLMVKVNWELTLLLILLLLLFSFLIFLLARWQTSYIITSRSTRSSLLAYVARQFGRFKKLKEQNEEQQVITNFQEKSHNLFHFNMNYNLSESLFLSFVPVLIFSIIGILLWRMLHLHGMITAGEGFMLILILLMMEGGIRRLLKVPTYINKGKISLQKIVKLNQEPAVEVK